MNTILTIILLYVHGWISILGGLFVGGLISAWLIKRVKEDCSNAQLICAMLFCLSIIAGCTYGFNLLANLIVGYHPCYVSIPLVIITGAIFRWMFPGEEQTKEEEKKEDVKIIDVK